MPLPAIGAAAPPLQLQSHLDGAFDLEALRGRPTVIAFFPLAWTPV